VVLRNDRQGKLVKPADYWTNRIKYHWRLKVLKPAGKRYSEVRIRAQKYSRVSNVEARTIKPDGTIVPVAKDQIFDNTWFQIGNVKFTEKVFNFPAVEPGAILEYRYDRYDDFFFFVSPWYFEGPEFTLESRVTQAVPEASGYMVLCDLCEGTKPEVSDYREGKEKGQSYSVTLRNLPGYREEVLMPPPREVSPRLELVLQSWKDVYWTPLGRQDKLFTDWASVGKLVKYNYEEVIKGGQKDIKPVADQWVQGLAEPQDKVRAVLRHVQQDFGYIPFSQVVGGSRSIAALLKDKNADNEEKAVLMLAALRALGVESFPALVSGKDEGSVNPKFFSLSQFTHAVAVVPGPGGALQYLDPTISYAPAGFMPWQDSGADALLLRENENGVVSMPVKNELSTTKFKVTVKPRPDAKADLDIEARFSGEDAIELREELIPASESKRNDFMKSWLSKARDGAVLVSWSAENLDKIEEPLVLKIKAEAGGLVTLAEGIQIVQGCVLFCQESNPISKAARQHPFYVDRGWNDSQEVLIVPPTGMKAAPVPLGSTARSAIGSMSLSCVSHDEEGVVCSRQFIARRNRWAASERESIRTMFDKIVEADRTAVSFQAEGASN
jgi:transglutaminase-like putative cysteine protease